MARIPDRIEFDRRWRAMEFRDRRRVVRAVNRGTQVDSRKEAALAVVLARRQQRFWRGALVLGPVLAVLVAWVTDTSDDVAVILANAALGALGLAAVSWWWLRNARRAEALNTEHALRGRR